MKVCIVFLVVIMLGCAELRPGCEAWQEQQATPGGLVCVNRGASADVPAPIDDTVPGEDVPSMPCPAGLSLCGGFCRDTRSDAANCGACDLRCGTSQVCTAGICESVVGCSTPRVMCGASCTDPSSDASNCGSCGRVCPSGTACSGGTCVCPTGASLCGSACVFTLTDRANCGACGFVCSAGQVCIGGACSARCGDGTCNGGETCTSCPTDCGACSARCGDGMCNGGEACTTCPGDCGACACTLGEGVACTPGATAPNCCTGGRACANEGSFNACVAPDGAACTRGEGCRAGSLCCGRACTPVSADVNNCGGCGVVCGAGQSCSSGVCTSVCSCGVRTCGPVPGAGCGGSCGSCSTGYVCNASGTGCNLNPSSSWIVTAVSGTVSSLTPAGVGWDVGTAPDPYLCLTINGVQTCTEFVSDTYYPRWVMGRFPATTASALMAGIPSLYGDDDTADDDFICAAGPIRFSDADFLARSVTFSCGTIGSFTLTLSPGF